jgi:hypothetical protein
MTGLCVLDHGSDRPQAVVGFLCGKHRRRLDMLTSDVNVLWCELALVLDGSAPREHHEQTRHTKAAEAPAPLDLGAVALRDPRSYGELPSVASVVASWVLLLAEERPLGDTLPASVVAQLALLTRHGDWISAQGWVDDYARELEELRTALRHAVGDKMRVRPVGKCPSQDGDGLPCEGPLVPSETGRMAVDCRRCGRHYDETILRHLGGMMSAG